MHAYAFGKDLPASIAAGFRAMKDDCGPSVSDRTWRDLSLDDVFRTVDRCLTHIGQQWLYLRLRTPAQVAAPMAELDQRVRAFEDEGLRDAVKSALRPVGDRGLPSLLYGEAPAMPRGAAFFPLATVATLVAAVATFVWPVAILALVACVLGNIALRFCLNEAMSIHAAALASLGELVAAGQRLSVIESMGLSRELLALRAAVAEIEHGGRALSWLALDVHRLGEFASIVVTYLNVMFLVDVNAFVRGLALLRGSKSQLRAIYETIGELDTARSIALYRAETAVWTTPIFTSRGSPLVAHGIVHPLVGTPVGNDAHLRSREGWLVLGSNMAGKSTYLRALALGAILGQSIATVPAEMWAAPVVSVRTLIQIEDDVNAGKSHFLAEAEASRDLLVEGKGECDRLCLVDELFRGTNTDDRVAAASAFLRALSRRGDFVLAATHDAELVALLESDYVAKHFGETVTDGVIAHDYRLRDGGAAPRNALAVLALAGFPDDVIADARTTACRPRRVS